MGWYGNGSLDLHADWRDDVEIVIPTYPETDGTWTGTPTSTTTALGEAFAGDGATFFRFDPGAPNMPVSPPFSCFAVLSGSPYGFGAIVANRHPTDNNGGMFRVTDPVGGLWRIQMLQFGATGFPQSSRVVDQTDALSYISFSIDASNNWLMYYNGAQVGSGTYSLSLLGAGHMEFAASGRGLSAAVLDYNVQHTMVFRIALSTAQHEALHADPTIVYADVGETLSIAGLSIALSLDSPALTQAGTLAVNDTDIATTLDAVTLSAALNLTVADLLSSVTLDSPALVQANALAVQDTDIAVTLDTPALTQAHALAVDDTDIGTSLDIPTLTAAGSLSIADLLLAVAIEQPLLTQAHQLSVADLAMGITLDGVTLTTGLTLTVDGVDIALSLDNVSLTQAGVLVIQGLDIPLSVDAVTLTQAHALTVADLLSAVSLDSPELSTAGNVLSVHDAQIAVTLDSPALTQSHILAVNDAVIAVPLGGITIVIPGAEVERYPRITLSRINRVTLDRINQITLSR